MDSHYFLWKSLKAQKKDDAYISSICKLENSSTINLDFIINILEKHVNLTKIYCVIIKATSLSLTSKFVF